MRARQTVARHLFEWRCLRNIMFRHVSTQDGCADTHDWPQRDASSWCLGEKSSMRTHAHFHDMLSCCYVEAVWRAQMTQSNSIITVTKVGPSVSFARFVAIDQFISCGAVQMTQQANSTLLPALICK